MNTQFSNSTLGFLVSDVSRLIRRDFAQRVAGLGLTQAQWRTLAHLARAEGCRQADLAAVMEIAPITLARFVDRLEQAGLVERRKHPTDRRAVQLYHTAKGRRLLEKMRPIAGCTYDRALKDISPADREQFLQMLERVRDNLSDPATFAGSPGRKHSHGR